MSLDIKIENLYSELFKWSGYNALHCLLSDFNDLKIYLAGGSVRNVIIGESNIKDFDFFIDGGNKEETLDYLSKTGKVVYGPFGSPRWYPEGEDSIYCDLIWIREFYNGLWYCKDIIDVLNQFDFTANAIAIDLETAYIFDHQNGIRDIEKRIIRAVRFDYPNALFSEKTSLRRQEVLWFRLLHYASKYNMEIEPVTKSWIEKNNEFSNKKDEFEKLFFKPEIAL